MPGPPNPHAGGPTDRPARDRGARLHDAQREDILALRLRPGVELDEGELAQRFACSRTAVRKALLALSGDHLVELLPDRGARVAALDLVELPRFVETIDLLARATSRHAAARRSDADLAAITSAARLFEAELASGDTSALTARDRGVHMAVARAADNPYLEAACRRPLDEGMRMIHLAFGRARTDAASRSAHLRRVARTRDALVAAIRDGDGATAEAMARAHTELFHRRMRQCLDTDGDAVIEVEPGAG